MGKLIEKIKKRLYEWSKPDIEPLKLEVTHTELKHYAACQSIAKREFQNEYVPQEVIVNEIIRGLMNKFKPVIEKNLETEEDIYNQTIVYRVDIWLKL